MKIISHRGNIFGPNEKLENSPEYLKKSIELGFDIELDVWRISENWYFGHDEPQYQINFSWFEEHKYKMWVHCKNLEALVFFNTQNKGFNYFWHENDTVTLTSKGNIWAYPGKQPIKSSIAVMPEIYNDNLSECFGICTDYAMRYRDELNTKQ